MAGIRRATARSLASRPPRRRSRRCHGRADRRRPERPFAPGASNTLSEAENTLVRAEATGSGPNLLPSPSRSPPEFGGNRRSRAVLGGHTRGG
jgi:hypothetical protein